MQCDYTVLKEVISSFVKKSLFAFEEQTLTILCIIINIIIILIT